jgi:hypothetical protein
MLAVSLVLSQLLQSAASVGVMVFVLWIVAVVMDNRK